MGRRGHRSGHSHSQHEKTRPKKDPPGLPQLVPTDGRVCYFCAACQQRMTFPGGYGGTRMCGPCATGEAATMEEVGETW